MIKYILSLLLLFPISLKAVGFVVFTEPKTGNNFIASILYELTGKKNYWPKEYMADVEPPLADYLRHFKNPRYIFFALSQTPWKRETMDKVWQVNERNNTFLHLHPPYSPVLENYLKEKGCINFFMKRDPRDQIISLLNHYKYIEFLNKQVEALPSDDERLLYMIRNHSRSWTLHYMGWLKSPVCCVLDFAKLMGSHGGAATDLEALKEVRKIADALQIEISDADLKKIYRKHLGNGWTFFKGKVGVWKEVFKDAHKKAIKEEIGDLLIELGYERDLKW